MACKPSKEDNIQPILAMAYQDHNPSDGAAAARNQKRGVPRVGRNTMRSCARGTRSIRGVDLALWHSKRRQRHSTCARQTFQRLIGKGSSLAFGQE